MVRTRRSRRADRAKLYLGLVLLAVVLAVVVGALVLRGRVAADLVALDPQTQCPLDGPRSVTVVMVDRTDPISAITQLALRNELKGVAGATPRYGALYLYAVDGASDGVPAPLFMRCNPGDASSVSGLTRSKAKVQAQFEQGFSNPLNTVLAELTEVRSASASPIMEAVQAAALTAFGDAAAKGATTRRLIVVSDFMQNSDRVSFYRTAAAQALQAPEGLEAPLRGVQVGLLFIQRPERPGPAVDELKTVWRDYFIQSGVAPQDVRPVKLTGFNP